MKHRGWIAVIILLLPITVFSQTATGSKIKTQDESENGADVENVMELSLDDAIYRALKNNLGLKSSALNFDKTKWSLYTCWNSFLPTITGSGTLSVNALNEDDRKGSGITVVGTPDQYGLYDKVYKYNYTTPQVMPTVAINVNWNFNAAMIFSAYQTCLDYQSGKITYESAKRSLLKNVKTSYYSLLLAQLQLDIKRNDLASKEEQFKQTQAQFQSGLTTRLNMLNVRVAYESAKPALISQKDTVTNSANTLKYLLGIGLEYELKLTDSVSSVEQVIPDFDDIAALFEKNNLDLRTLHVSKRMVQNASNQYIAGMTPTFSLGYTGSSTFTKEAFENDWFADEEDWSKSSSLNLTVSVPFSAWIPFSSYQVGLVGSNVALRKMDTDIQNFILGKRLTIQQSIDSIASAIQNIKITQMSVDVAQEALKLSREAYRMGNQTLLELHDVENNLLTAKYQELAAEFQYISNMLGLEELLNIDMNEIIKMTKEKMGAEK